MATIDYLFRAEYGEYRPCYVNGEKALFHRWKDVDQVYVKTKHMFNREMEDHIKRRIDARKIVWDGSVDFMTAHNVVAIVEFEDGTVADVDGKDIQFIDGAEKFEGICWDREMKSDE